MLWLSMIKNSVISSFRIEQDDFDLNPVNTKSGLGEWRQLSGEETTEIINELNEFLAA